MAQEQKLIRNKQLTQLGVNRVLWKIIAQRGSIKIKADQLARLPENAAIRIDHNATKDEFTLTAIVHQPSNIIVRQLGNIIT